MTPQISPADDGADPWRQVGQEADCHLCQDMPVGYFNYGADSYDIDDRTLVHVQTVVAQKLRRRERFMLTFETVLRGASVTCSVWMSDAADLSFSYSGSREARMDQDLLKEMMHASYSATGLNLTHFSANLRRAI